MLIGLSGKMGTGKSTLAKYLMDKQPNSVIVKIAGLLYELQDMIYTKLGIKLEGEKDRPLLIALGMWGRDKDENFWTDIALKQAKERPEELVIIDDIRFPNEAKALEDAGGILIRIEGKQRGDNLTPESMNNVTETSLDDYNFKYRIDNSFSVEHTLSQLENILTN